MQLTHDTDTSMSSTNPNVHSGGYLGTYIIEGRAFMRVRGSVIDYQHGGSRLFAPERMPYCDDSIVMVYMDTGASCIGRMQRHERRGCIYLPEDHTDAEELFITVIA